MTGRMTVGDTVMTSCHHTEHTNCPIVTTDGYKHTTDTTPTHQGENITLTNINETNMN